MTLLALSSSLDKNDSAWVVMDKNDFAWVDIGQK